MAVVEEVTKWIAQLGRGDVRAAEVLWAQYFSRLVRYARRKLDDLPRRAEDEEDAALSAMNSFCQGLLHQRFGQLNDREDLWKLLITITARKVCAQRRRHFASKRGGGQARGGSAFMRTDPLDEREEGIGQVLGSEPTPELAAMVADDCRHFLARLGDKTLREVAIDTLQGFRTAEIAERLGVSQRSVQRKLDTIREIWSSEAPP